MKHLLLLSFLIFQNYLSAQRSYTLQPMDAMPVIDGIAIDSAWLNVPETGDFTTTLPRFGQTPQQNTYVKMGYANGYIFIMARCQSQSVRADGSERDEVGQADYFSVGFDTWNDDQQAYWFTVTAAGQILDSNEGTSGFDAASNVATSTQSDGWTLEMAIPFAVLRYPAEQMDWGLQFTRFDRSTGETSNWNPHNPLIIDDIWQFGSLTGPLMNARIRFRTLSVYGESRYHKSRSYFLSPQQGSTGAGFDGQWALGSATTLDVAILGGKTIDINPSAPYFSLSDYTPYLNRPINATGTSLYNRFNANIEGLRVSPQLYSNLIFDELQPGEYVRSFFGGSHLNDIKITHRTRNNWRFGTINRSFSSPGAVIGTPTGEFEARRYYAIPFANFSTAEKLFRNNSWFNVSMASIVLGNHLNRNILATGGQWRDRSNRFEISGNWYINLQNASVKRLKNLPDGELNIKKINGAWRYGIEYSANNPYNRNNIFSLYYPVNPQNHPNFLSAFLSKHNFQPRQSWINNIAQGIRINTSGVNQDEDKVIYNNYSYFFHLQNQRFQQFNCQITSGFGKTQENLQLNNQLTLSKTVYAPISLDAGFTTDLRKKSVISNYMKWAWSPLSDHWIGQLGNKIQIKLNNQWNLSNHARLSYIHNEKTAVNTGSGAALVRVFNTADFSNSLAVNYTPNRFSAHRLNFIVNPSRLNSNERIYEIEEDLTWTPYPIGLPSYGRISYFLGLNSTFWAKAGTRYQLSVSGQKIDARIGKPAPDYDPDAIVIHFALTFIHNFVNLN